MRDFCGTEQGLKKKEQVELWRAFWLEYVGAFFDLVNSRSKSVVTVYIGRHAVELGFKYLLLSSGNTFPRTHNLGVIAKAFISDCSVDDEYMNEIEQACEYFSLYIEDENDEYFRYPDYKKGKSFAGNALDIEWLSYNLTLMILKQMHYAKLDYVLDNMREREL